MKRARIARLVTVTIGLCPAADIYAAGKKTKPTAPPHVHTQSSKAQNSASPKGVVAKFAQAMQVYNQGKYADALVLFDSIHKTYPAHEPTTIQYAKTLYRLDRIPESYNLFARVNPLYLDPETSYEYGYAFYIQTRYDGAIFSFKRVPLDHPLYDLANYYSAMSAIRLKRYAEAEEFLDKAVVLPDKLARSKLLYQKHVSSLRQLQEKADLERETQAEKQRITGESAKSKTSTSPSQTTATTPAKPTSDIPLPYVHGGYYSILRQAKLKFVQSSQSSDLHGFKRKNYLSKTGSFTFDQGALTPLPLKYDKDRQAAAGIQINLAAASVTTEGTQERLVASESSRDIVQNLTERLPTETTNTGDIGGKLWIETPMASGWWFGIDGHLGFTYPNFERGQRYGVRGATGNLTWIKSATTSYNLNLNGTYDLIVDAETEPVTSQTIGDINLTVTTDFSMDVLIGARYTSYNYMLPILPGPDTSASASVSLTQSFPLGISLSTGGTIERQENYISRSVATFTSASADGQKLSGFVKMSASPVKLLSFSAKHTRSKTTWVVRQSERIEAFKAATPDYTESTDLVASLNLSF